MNDLERGFGSVELPFALALKYPHADKELAWQYIFPSNRLSTDPRSGITRRHHLDPSGLQRAVKAVRSPLDEWGCFFKVVPALVWGFNPCTGFV